MKLRKKKLLILTVLLQIVFLPTILKGQKQDTATCLTNLDKKVLNIVFKELENCENNSKEKDTIISQLGTRLLIKDSALFESKTEVKRLKTNNENLFKQNLETLEELKTSKTLNYVLSGLLLIETLIIIGLL